MPRERGGLLECGDTLFSWVFAAKAVWPAGRIKRALVSAATFAMLLQTLVCLRRVKQRPPEHDLAESVDQALCSGGSTQCGVRSTASGTRFARLVEPDQQLGFLQVMCFEQARNFAGVAKYFGVIT